MAPERCPYCGRWYAVHPRLWGRRKTCGDKKCRAEHKAELNWKWREEHPEAQRERNKAVRERRGRERYWDEWRSKTPDYVKRNREQTRERGFPGTVYWGFPGTVYCFLGNSGDSILFS